MATDARSEWTVSTAGGVRSVLSDDRFAVPEPPGGAPAGTLAWLRSSACRFSNGAEHDRRRAVVTGELDRLDTGALADAARELTLALIAGLAPGGEPGTPVEVMGPIARQVPVAVLAARLGAADPGLAADAVRAIGGSYLTGAPADEAAADAATRALLGLLGPLGPGEDIAVARATMLLQSFDATAGLIGNALALLPELPAGIPTSELLAQAALRRPPVRAMRRVARVPADLGGRPVADGDTVICDIDTASIDSASIDSASAEAGSSGSASAEGAGAEASPTFGYGLRPCPAAAHAVALARGVVDAVRERCTIPAGQDELEPVRPLRVPARLEAVLR